MTNYYNCSAEYYRNAPHHKIMLVGLMSVPLGLPCLLCLIISGTGGDNRVVDLLIPAFIFWFVFPFICLTVWTYFDLKLAKTNDQLKQEEEQCQNNH